jgi:hypothetical protein
MAASRVVFYWWANNELYFVSRKNENNFFIAAIEPIHSAGVIILERGSGFGFIFCGHIK